MTKVMAVFLVICFMLLCLGLSAAEKEAMAQKSVKGEIKEIAEDGSYILVGDSKILTSEDFLDGSYIEVGDNVEVIAEETEQGLKALDYDFIFDDDESLYTVEDDLLSIEEDTAEEPEEEVSEEESPY